MTDTKNLESIAKRLVGMSTETEHAYEAGREAGIQVNNSNCHFRFFATPELTAAWQRGYDEVKNERRPDDQP